MLSYWAICYRTFNWHAAGEVCNEWQTWSEYLHVNSIFGQSLLHAAIYIALSVSSRAYTYVKTHTP